MPSLKKGFTLIELLITISIIGILAALGFASYSSAQVKARDSQRKSDAAQVQRALELYKSDIKTYPISGGGTWWTITGPTDSLNSVLIANGSTKKAFVDPVNNAYFSYFYNSPDGYSYAFEIRYENPNEKDYTGTHSGGGAGSPSSCGICPMKQVTNP